MYRVKIKLYLIFILVIVFGYIAIIGLSDEVSKKNNEIILLENNKNKIIKKMNDIKLENEKLEKQITELKEQLPR